MLIPRAATFAAGSALDVVKSPRTPKATKAPELIEGDVEPLTAFSVIGIPVALLILVPLRRRRAGRVQADVVDGTTTVVALKKEGQVLQWLPDVAQEYPADVKDPAGYWIANNLFINHLFLHLIFHLFILIFVLFFSQIKFLEFIIIFYNRIHL